MYTCTSVQPEYLVTVYGLSQKCAQEVLGNLGFEQKYYFG